MPQPQQRDRSVLHHIVRARRIQPLPSIKHQRSRPLRDRPRQLLDFNMIHSTSMTSRAAIFPAAGKKKPRRAGNPARHPYSPTPLLPYRSPALITPMSPHLIERIIAPAFLLMGLSHFVQPQLWVLFFQSLHKSGLAAIIIPLYTLPFGLALIAAHNI